MNKIFAFFIKEIKLLLRDPGGLLLLFVLPACFIIILSVSLQGTFSSAENTKNLDIVVVNKDKGIVSKRIIETLSSYGIFNIITNFKGHDIDLQDAKSLLKEGKYKIVVVIPEDASETIDFKKESTIEILLDPVLSNDFAMHVTNAIQSSVYQITLESLLNLSDSIATKVKYERIKEIDKQILDAKTKKQEILDMLVTFKKSNIDSTTLLVIEELNQKYVDEFDQRIKDLLEQKNNIMKNISEKDKQKVYQQNILKVKQKYFFNEKEEIVPNSVQQNVPGWTIFALFWIAQIITINIMSERDSGAFKRIFVSPVKTVDFFLGKILPFFIINILQAFVMFSLGIFILPLFSLPPLYLNDILSLVIVTVAISFSAISFGLLIASISKTVFIAASLSGILAILMTAIGGIMIPKFVMPKFMQNMTFLVVHGWALDAYLNIFVKNIPLKDNLVNIFIILAFGILFFIVALINFKKRIKQS